MILSEMTSPEVDALSRDTVVLIPTGSLEQHGAHLPLFTDSLLATAVATSVEKSVPDKTLLAPCLWLGASGHHLPFCGTLSASMQGYMDAIRAVIVSLNRHRFTRFLIVNGHGGNNEPNGVVLRMLKEELPNVTLGHRGYYQYNEAATAAVLEGPIKGIQHACEAETSLMMYLFPNMVRKNLIRNDGLRSTKPTQSIVKNWDEISESGPFGFSELGTPEKGKAIFESACKGVLEEVEALFDGVVYKGIF